MVSEYIGMTMGRRVKRETISLFFSRRAGKILAKLTPTVIFQLLVAELMAFYHRGDTEMKKTAV